MDIQNTFYVIASVALLLVCGFVIFLSYTVYKIWKIVQGGMRIMSTAARETQHSVENLTKGWTQTTFIGLAFKMLKGIIKMGKG